MDNTPSTDSRTSAIRKGPWGWQKRVVVGILLAIGVYYALALPVLALRFSVIPLGLVFIVLAIAATRWWPGSSPRDHSTS